MLPEWIWPGSLWEFFVPAWIWRLEFQEPGNLTLGGLVALIGILFAAIALIAFLFWNHFRQRSAPALVFPTLAPFKGMTPTLRLRARVLIPILQSLAVLLFLVALLGPRTGNEEEVILSEGIAIQMVLDRSGSMQRKMLFEGRMRSRMDIVKEVFRDFVSGDADEGGELPGRKTDLIGLTTFARFTEENCPLVAEHEPVLTAVANLTTVPEWLDKFDQPVSDRRKAARQNPFNATAIGDGLFRAVTSIVAAEADIGRGEEEGGYKIKGKVVVLLTDGENNAGDREPVEAGKYAQENDIRVYYVLLRERVERRVHALTGEEVVVGEYSEDQLLEEPRKVAGDPSRAYLATDGDALRRIYEEIDRLERSEIGRLTYRTYEQRFHFFLFRGLLLGLLAMVLGETILRRMP